VLSAAERNDALLVSLENVYGYGPTAGRPKTEDLPLASMTVKGRTRAAMTQELLAAAHDGRSGSRSVGHLTSSVPASPSRHSGRRSLGCPSWLFAPSDYSTR
jgi:hypothetical protein